MEKEILKLMFKDYEVLIFEVDYIDSNVKIIKKLDHFDLAPYEVKDRKDNIDLALLYFFNSRSIPPQRCYYDEIIKATKCRDGFELSFKGHGLSLNNHYWFKREGEENLKYDQINFFTNKWDDSFARCVINEDFVGLAKCDLNVPDIVTSGWGIKGWLYEDGPKLYKLGIVKHASEESIVECLISRLASRLFKEDEYVKYELKKINRQYASVCSPFINKDEELLSLGTLLPNDLNVLYQSKSVDRNKTKEFLSRIKNSNYPELYLFFVKLFCLRSLCFLNDLHFDNIGMIHNLKTGEYKIAPLYDIASGFGSSKNGKAMLSKVDKSTLFLVYYLYSDLDSRWDYSWYNPKSLDGFEQEIREYLSKSDFYNEKLIDTIIMVYQKQKESLNKIAKKN